MSFRVRFEGDLARALEWEAGRRGESVQKLVSDLVRSCSRQSVTAWRVAHRNVLILRRRLLDGSEGSVEEVLLLAQGRAKP